MPAASAPLRRARAPRLLLLAALGGSLLISGASAGNRENAQPLLQPRTSTSPFYEAWVPPGTYTAFVINSSGVQRQWDVALITRNFRVPVVVRPGENVIIPFEGGWKIVADDKVRFESDRVPFFDHSLLDPLDGSDTFVLSAWGITRDGPVPFVIKPDVPDWVLKRAGASVAPTPPDRK